MRELPQLLQIPPHFHHKVIEFGLEIMLDAVAKQLRESPKHGQRVSVRKPDSFQVFDSGYELFFNATRQQIGVLAHLRYANALEEVQGGAEAILHAASKQSRSSVYDPFKLRPVNTSLPNEKGENRDDVRDPRGENFGTHTDNSPELDRREAHGSEKLNGGFDIRKRSGNYRRVVVDEGEEVDANGVKVEHFLLEIRVEVRGERWGHGRNF